MSGWIVAMTTRRFLRMLSLIGAPATLMACADSTHASEQTSRASHEIGATPGHRPVLVELFTSEGCISCPPADNVLSDLVTRQPIEGVYVVGLGEHVDYWDRLGWRDPFSSPLFTRRQSEYDAKVFRSNRIYTPQIVVDGHTEAIGSDTDAVRRAIQAAAQRPNVNVVVRLDSMTDAEARVWVHVEMALAVGRRNDVDVFVAVTEDRLVTAVPRGENQGRTLNHHAVVRSLTTVGSIPGDQGTFQATVSVPLEPAWKSEDVRIVSFVQERQSLRILGTGVSVLHQGATTRSLPP